MKHRLELGDLILVKGTRWYSKIISKVTHSPYTHVAVHMHDGILLESDWNGVQASYIQKYAHVDYDVYRHTTATTIQLEDMVSVMLSKYGTGYDYLGIVGVGYSLFTGKENRLDNKKLLWCSEYYADSALESKIQLDVDSGTHTYSPGDISRDSNIMFICNKKDVIL
jgi:uncharacterized protein YycO